MLFINPTLDYGGMPPYSRLVFCTACTVMLILACLIAGCSSSPAPSTVPAQTASPGGTAITIKNFAFDPPALSVKAGTTVTWTNQDSVPHTIASDTGSPVSFSSESLAPGSSYSFTFTQAGTYTYHCSIHPSMKGTVIVQ
jgi:amicyanin